MKYFFYILVITLMLGCSREEINYQYVSIDEKVRQSSNFEKNRELVKRFSEYWEATSLKDFETAYNYELPYLNFLKSLDWYLEFKTVSKKNFKTTMLSLTEDKDDKDIVHVRLNIKSKKVDANVTEKWININGTWYHNYSQSILPPKPPRIRK